MGLGPWSRRGAWPVKSPWGYALEVAMGLGPLSSPWGWAPDIAVGLGP